MVKDFTVISLFGKSGAHKKRIENIIIIISKKLKEDILEKAII